MNLPAEYYPLMEMRYREMIDKQQAHALVAKEKLLSLDAEQIKTAAESTEWNRKSQYIIAMKVIKYFDGASFFCDTEALAKLQSLKLSPNELKWFIPLSKIHEQYDLIRSYSIKIDTLLAFTYIKSYLKSKFGHEVLINYLNTNHDGVIMTQLSKELLLLKGKRRYSQGKLSRYKNAFEYALNNQVNEFTDLSRESNDANEFDINILFKFSRGKTEFYFLKKLITECFDYDKEAMTETKFLGIVYELLRLLIQDRNMINEIDFLSPRNRIYQSYKSFEAYKAKKLKSLIYPKRRPQ